MKRLNKHLLIGTIVSISTTSCNEPGSLDNSGSDLASVKINELNANGYEKYIFAMTPAGNGTTIAPKTYNRGSKAIEASVIPGKYEIKLDYLKGEVKVYSADYCKEPAADEDNVRTLVAGLNLLKVKVCDQQGSPASADLEITPVFEGGGKVEKPIDVPSQKPKDELEKACQPGEVDLIHEDSGEGGAVFTRHFPDSDQALRNAAIKVCTVLYKDAKEVRKLSKLTLNIKPFDGVAYASGDSVSFSSTYIENYAKSHSESDTKSELMGVVVHEFTHLYQNAKGAPAWELEGMADFVRYKAGYINDANRRKGGNYTDSYKTTAFFFEFLDKRQSDFAYRLNQAAKEWPAANRAFQDISGKSVDALWNEYQASL